MQLDQTHVVIRLRTMSEIGDLALVMIRRYPAALLIGFAAGAVPWAVANLLLLGWIPIAESGYGLDDEEAMTEIARYMTWMAILVVAQAPAAGIMTTVYLGQAVFEQRPTWASVFQETKRLFTRWFWALAVVRLTVPMMMVLAVRWGQPVSAFWDVIAPVVFLLCASLVRAGRPFLPEILMLEQCPLRSQNENVITAKRRSKSLHSPVASDLTGRFVAAAFVLTAVFLSVLYTLMWARGITIGQWAFLDLTVLLVMYPLALWIVAGISVLVRLLNYLDTRIRLEGWEVELAVRAEAIRQFGDSVDAPIEPVTTTCDDVQMAEVVS
ncbi:hypothetical protein [Rubripirellula reticaptiva]|uniref:Transmembrane protein n=1 Tax=Rubripirellula reticaptiva TaxID=2528013 RepID=A0A5C6F8X5_9BACT|nr:hypothetical protein [Rubripirellula reticaptiva]TWU56169.1 hypothetical protein Poly59_24730 [Rubripirellula reticaptiva]